MATAIIFLHADIIDFQLYLIPNDDVEYKYNEMYAQPVGIY